MGEIAFAGDIEAMFYNFYLPREDRDYLRFFWYAENKPNNEITQFRGRVHLFGNRCSPAIAHSGLKYATQHIQAQKLPTAVNCIIDNIYVDDLLASCRQASIAAKTLEDIREILQRYHIRLCKIVSNSNEVLQHFPKSERADCEEVSIGDQTVHRALGMSWLIRNDSFFIKADIVQKPLSRRGLLSVTNSIYDPLGIVNPVVLQGRLLQRKALHKEINEPPYDWDDPLPKEFAKEWQSWLDSLSTLSEIGHPRSYIPVGFEEVSRYELHTFTDASEAAIGAVVYLRIFDINDSVHVSYVISSSKLTPKACISIPRGELCAALLGSKLMQEVVNELNVHFDLVKMYCDSEVVLSYLLNRDKRFAKYVTHRVGSILKLTNISQWQYINTFLNPADIACRPQSESSLKRSVWLKGPSFLWEGGSVDCSFHPCSDLPETLKEKTNLKSTHSSESPFQTIITRVGTLRRAVGVATMVIRFCRLMIQSIGRSPPDDINDWNQVIELLVLTAQQSSYPDLIACIKHQRDVKDHNLASLDPFIDSKGLLRVGGRLKDSFLCYDVKHPLLLPSKHPLSTLIIQHYHASTNHQGRHLTLGAIRSAGYFIEKCSKVMKVIISQCVTCRKLRAQPEEQMMASLPKSRIEETPPFYNTGVDCFGPFLITESKSTRQTKATKKIWGVIFTCMVSRAIHVETLNGLDTSSFTNALKRFLSVRGTCKNFYSDRGTNFIGHHNQEATMSMEEVGKELHSKNCSWHFIPPHASHFGGAWERKIGALKKIFEGSINQLNGRALSRDEFSTLMCEAASIVNNTPMWEITADPKDPLPISPAMLMTLRDNPDVSSLHSYTADDLASYGAKRWKRVQFLADCFWKNWRTYYLASLQERTKWKQKRRNVAVGDVVLLKDNNERRNMWPMATVKSVKTSSDDLVRSVEIETMSGSGSRRVLQRPISKIVVLIPNE